MARWLLIMGLFAVGMAAPMVRAADHPADGVEGSVEHGPAAKPDLPLKFQGDLALWSAVTFLFFLFALSKLAWRPLIDGMNAREGKIRKDIDDAEANRAKSETMFREYEAKLAKAQDEVREILAEARRDAGRVKQDMIATAEKESASMRERAVSEIDRARDGALGELFDFVSKNVMQATEQVVGRSLTGADQERLVKEALASLDLRKN